MGTSESASSPLRPYARVPPVFENPDRFRCFQAVLRAVLQHSFPQRNYTWEELDGLTGRRPGCWTWPTTALLALKDLGMNVVTFEDFDYRDFANRGEEYLVEYLGPEGARAQVVHTDVAYEREIARRFVEQHIQTEGTPDFTAMGDLLGEGYLIICNVNVKALNGERGYSGHFVLVYDLDESAVWLHDPGPPAWPGRAIWRQRFMEAWAFPNERNRNLIALKPTHKDLGSWGCSRGG